MAPSKKQEVKPVEDKPAAKAESKKSTSVKSESKKAEVVKTEAKSASKTSITFSLKLLNVNSNARVSDKIITNVFIYNKVT